MNTASECLLLVDNGSRRAGSVLQLRKLASQLSELIGETIYPVSLNHANKIDPTKLGGEPALTFTPFMDHQLQQGLRQFTALPLFFGESGALTSFLPDQLQLLRQQQGDFQFRLCDPVYPLPQGEPLLVELLYQQVMTVAQNNALSPCNVVLVDHGSPSPRVTAVRQNVAEQLSVKLTEEGFSLEQAVMERREGVEYDFNGDLLEDWLTAKAEMGETRIIVALMFFLPGRHAGEGGDIDEICSSVEQKYSGLKIFQTGLISEHHHLLTILKNRLQ